MFNKIGLSREGLGKRKEIFSRSLSAGDIFQVFLLKTKSGKLIPAYYKVR